MRERLIESKLSASIKKLGGLCIKLPAIYLTGIPDRLCLLPGGRMFFAETKAPGKKPGKLQLIVHEKIRALGFKVEVIDSVERVNEVLNERD